MRIIGTDVFARFGRTPLLHVVGQPQPRLCHVRENHLGVRIIDDRCQLEAGLGTRSVQVPVVQGTNFSIVTIARLANATRGRLFRTS